MTTRGTRALLSRRTEMTARIVRPDRDHHRHADDMTARGVAGWMGCEVCQHGRPLLLSAAAAHAIARILAPLQKGGER